jgi:hypothetical protein
LNQSDKSIDLRSRVLSAVERPNFGGTTTSSGVIVGSNQSAADLEKCGVAILPVIEDVLRTESPRWFARADRFKAAFGLDSLLWLYARMAHESDWSPAGTLLQHLPGDLRDELLSAFYRGYGPNLGSRRWTPVRFWFADAIKALHNGDHNELVEDLFRIISAIKT